MISGSPPALLQMFKAATPSAQSRSSVQIRGDAEIANLYRELFRCAARPDLEEELSRWIGDLPARHLSQLALSVRTWARRVRRAAGENIAEYLQEEVRDLVTINRNGRVLARRGRHPRRRRSPLKPGSRASSSA